MSKGGTNAFRWVHKQTSLSRNAKPLRSSSVLLPLSNCCYLQVEVNAWQIVRLQTNMAAEVDGLRREKNLRQSRKEEEDDEPSDRYVKIINDH